MSRNVTKEISAENTFTDGIFPEGFIQGFKTGHLNLSVAGTGWSATVTLQRSFDRGENWHDVESYTENEQAQIEDRGTDVMYRIGVKTGDYTSGTVDVMLSR